MSELACVLPEILDVSATESETTINFYIQEDISYFRGHFPEAPVLPGVVQLDWALYFARKYMGISSNMVKSVEVLKFQLVVQPLQDLMLHMVKKSDYKFSFKFTSKKGVHASGRVLIEAE